MREAPSIDIVKALTQAGAVCVCHCPEGTENAKPLLPTANVKFVDDIYSAAEGSDLIVLVTEWSQFRNPNWEKLSGLVRYKELWDGRNQYTPSRRRAEGWEYHCIGRGRAIER
jgi:UDPglucose 6-dehydrogenase